MFKSVNDKDSYLWDVIDLDTGKIIVGDKPFSFPRLPKEIIAIRDAGGLLAYTRNKLKNR